MFLREFTKSIKDNPKHILTKEKGKDITKFLRDKFRVIKFVYNRYTERKYFLHLSIILNYAARKPQMSERKLLPFVGGYNKNIRVELAKYARQNKVNIIGLDRGEKHLVYYSIINQNGEILDQGSLNEINGQNYRDKLVNCEKERLRNRQSWSPVAKIKDIKKGYVSQVVRKIADFAIHYNAIVVMEDLNMRFKQIRGGIERSVYQQLEKQLIDKFGYLIFKNRQSHEFGGVLKGYQLTAPFVSFEKMGKQTGIIFYTQAEYTSGTDPLTGFRKNVYVSNSASQKKIKETIEKFDAIGWGEEEQSYFFTYNPKNFVEERYKNIVYSPQKGWTVYAKVPRIRREKDEKGYWQYTPIDVNEKFGELFRLWEFEDPQAADLHDEICRKIQDGELEEKYVIDGRERSFYHAFIYLFNIVMQIRNSFSEKWESYEDERGETRIKSVGEDIDFIASPVRPFFSTYAKSEKYGNLSPLNLANFRNKIIGPEGERIIKEFNGDANGAYNIARKGKLILDAITTRPGNPDIYISEYDWDKFVQK